jgi:hypothetical protein
MDSMHGFEACLRGSRCLAARYLRVLETERDRSLDKQQRELIGEMTTPSVKVVPRHSRNSSEN